MTQQDRFSAVLDRLASGTNVLRTRAYDHRRAERNGDFQTERLEEVLVRLEGMADELWSAIEVR